MITVFAKSNFFIHIGTNYFEDIINRSLIQQPRIRQITNINQQFLLLLVPRIPENFKTDQNLPIIDASSWAIIKYEKLFIYQSLITPQTSIAQKIFEFPSAQPIIFAFPFPKLPIQMTGAPQQLIDRIPLISHQPLYHFPFRFKLRFRYNFILRNPKKRKTYFQ
jgi:hypothetical protein